MTPLCFILMPFGRKTDAQGRVTDFDQVHRSIIAPAIAAAGLEPIRADEEQVGGTIHKPMFERLMLCDYAIADVTGANPNVYYELGIRHALRPSSTVILFAEGTTLPFDLAPLRGLSYAVDPAGVPLNVEATVAAVSTRLLAARNLPHDDSPLFQLLDGMPRPEIDHRKTDIFRERMTAATAARDRLSAARRTGRQAVLDFAAELEGRAADEIEAGTMVDLFLSLRAVKAFGEMVDLYARMPAPLARTRMVREQLGFALNREERRDEAAQVLREVIADYGPSSETNGLLGRVHKDLWEEAEAGGRGFEAVGHLSDAIESYVIGFEADWRDPYPGVNAVTLMEMLDEPDPRQAELLPLVRYAAKQRIKGEPDYWDHATLVELAVLATDRPTAQRHLSLGLVKIREAFEPETTARNLRLIGAKRAARGVDVGWLAPMIAALDAAHKRFDRA